MNDTASKIPVEAGAEKKTPAAAPTTFENLRKEIDRVFESFGRGDWRFPFGSRYFDIELPAFRKEAWGIAPAVDISEKDKAFEITVELPGVKADDIDVKVAGGRLTIKGEKKEEKEEREKDYFVSERRYGAFTRSFQLPEGVDAEKIEAENIDGVLKLTLPKTAEVQNNTRKIKVKSKSK
ncbi:Hsp20/alpha crystallin family protein [Minwuia thermotolerans]|uniref:Molecular chaperone Hsp20 n=1 Tax=Minwuia thermotolerans TaxID=2056226 RepID=A0A2M9G3C3_9PROT|nr:Hsp20/alpha crystallin family protein [Minwuia thermotolerans]PJK30194.1 molecular chaperone Hsp20 [Minwuia thermotolerans]